MVDETNNQSESAESTTRRRRTFAPRRASTGLGSVPVVEPGEIQAMPGSDEDGGSRGAGGERPRDGGATGADAPAADTPSRSAGGDDLAEVEHIRAADAQDDDIEADQATGEAVLAAGSASDGTRDPGAQSGDATPVEPADTAAQQDGSDQDQQAASEAGIPRATGPTTLLFFQAPPVVASAPAPFPDDDQDAGEAEPETAVPPASRRRNRRRSGAVGAPTPTEDRSELRDEEPASVARPRRRVVEEITEPQKVKGSTRLEAKKQRRRDGRDAGRRRAVVTEAEFLARRESVERVMVVRSAAGRIEIGVLEDGILAEHYVAKAQNQSLIGNVYLGRVQNVLPSMEAAFVDIGRGRNAVLYSGEVDWEAAAENGEKNQPRRIELALKAGDRVLVQVTKDPVGHKGARLTSQVSLPGRYLVYVPNGSMNGISRKLPDTERARLKRILKEVLPEGVGVIVRTAAEGATEEQLTVDVNRLTAQWQHISSQVEKVQAPALLHSEPDLLVKIIRDVFNEDFSRLVIAGEDAQTTIESYLTSVAPDLLDRVERFSGTGDVFSDFRVQEQIEKALDRKVWLPSGGSLVIDRTEAMTVIDVNTGKFVGSGGNLEETVTKNNLEAAEEIVRQLRLRDVGGIIVIDFIDMVLETNRDLVLRRLVECLSRDRTKHQVAEVTSLGLVQMTRKKLGLGLAESMSDAPDRPVESKQEPRRRGKTPPPPPLRPATGSTHGITDDARNALALIAASTLHKDHHHEHPAAPAEEPAEPAAEAEPIIELPEVLPPPKARELAPDAESLLGAVLNALPEPKKPGQGRARSRRVSTPALTPGATRAHIEDTD